jgi:phosphinothricin acetyltransferase
MLIRPATPGDAEAIAELTNLYIRETAIHFATQEVRPDAVRADMERARGAYPWLTAEAEGGFAAFAKAGVWRERAAYRWTPECAVYVRPGMQRRGIGRALYAALLDTLRRQGYRSAVAGITLPNDPSVRLHESVGFVHAGTIRRAGFKFGAWHDVGFWQVMLRDDDSPAGAILPPDQPLAPGG